MITPIEELKIRAKKLLKVSPVPEGLQKLCQGKQTSPQPLQLKHCQRYIARQYGFTDWEHARQVLNCETGLSPIGYGEFWYHPKCTMLLNHWCRDYQEAQQVLAEQGGYLLPYKKQFVVVQKAYLEALGLDADDPLWATLDNNWCQGDQEVRLHLALKRVLAG